MASTDYPPSPNFTGIDFNPDFFPSTASEYVEFPVAQGTETFGTIYTTKIDTPTPSTDFDLLTSETGNLNIGTAVTTSKVITLGSSASSTILKGTNVTVTKLTTPAIDSTSASTNMTIGDNLRGGNLTLGGSSGHTGTINLGAGQTSGAINIGTGPRTSGGNVSILTAAASSANVQVLIGTAVNSNTVLYGSNVLVDTKMQTPIIEAKAAGTGMTIGSNITSGTITIGGTAQAGNVDIDTTSGGAHTITIGTAGSTTTSLKGLSVDVGTKITTPILNADAVGTAMTIGANITTGSLAIGGSAHTGVLSLGAGQTSGNLNIGTSTSRAASSAINIGTGSTTATVITVGTSTTSTVLNGTSVRATTKLTTPVLDCVTDAGTGNVSLAIGGTATSGNIVIGAALGSGDITIGGAQSSGGSITLGSTNTLLTATSGLTLGSGKGITCGGAVYSPALTNTQIGWSTVIQNSAQVNLTFTSQTILTSSNTLPIGVYLFTVNMNVQTWSPANLTNYLTMTWTNTTGCSVNIIPLACAGTNTLTSCTFSGVLTVTSATNTITLGGATNVSGYTCTIPFVSTIGYAQMSVCRIA